MANAAANAASGPTGLAPLIVVVGAGVAGLAAGAKLKKTGYRVVLLEASERLGGRVRTDTSFIGRPIELGAQLIHGSHGPAWAAVESNGWGSRTFGWPDQLAWKLDGRQQLVDYANPQVNEVEAVQDALACLSQPCGSPLLQELLGNKEDASLEDYLRQLGLSDRQIGLADGVCASDLGCNVSTCGLQELVTQECQWQFGDQHLLVHGSLSQLVQHLAQGLDVRCNSCVDTIDYSSQEVIRVILTDGQVFSCDCVIVTVPLPILRDGCLKFVPGLPAAKYAAANNIQTNSVAKLFLKFSQRFWSKDHWSIVCPAMFAQELWFFDEYAGQQGAEQAEFVVVLFISGASAARLAQEYHKPVCDDSLTLPPGRCSPERWAQSLAADRYAVQSGLEQLDAVLRPGLSSCAPFFLDWMLQDWSQEPHIRCGFSSPSIGAQGQRGVLAEPIEHRVFFAGEATNPSCDASIQACMVWAEAVADNVVARWGCGNVQICRAGEQLVAEMNRHGDMIGRVLQIVENKRFNSEKLAHPACILPHMYLGGATEATNVDALVKHEITAVFNCAENGIQTGAEFYGPAIRYRGVKALDMEGYDILDMHFADFEEFCDQALKDNRRCLIHCAAGINRSATLAVAYFMTHTKRPLLSAIAHCFEQRPIILWNEGFIMQLVKFAEKHNLCC